MLLIAYESQAQQKPHQVYLSLDLQDTHKKTNPDVKSFSPQEGLDAALKGKYPDWAENMKLQGSFTFADLKKHAAALSRLNRAYLEKELNDINLRTNHGINPTIIMNDDLETFLVSNSETIYLTDAQAKKGGYLMGVVPTFDKLGKVYHADLSGPYIVLTVKGTKYILLKADCLNPPTQEEVFFLRGGQMTIGEAPTPKPDDGSGYDEDEDEDGDDIKTYKTADGKTFVKVVVNNNFTNTATSEGSTALALNRGGDQSSQSDNSNPQTTDQTNPDLAQAPAPPYPDAVTYYNNRGIQFSDQYGVAQPICRYYARGGNGENYCYDGVNWAPCYINPLSYQRMDYVGGYNGGHFCGRESFCNNHPMTCHNWVPEIHHQVIQKNPGGPQSPNGIGGGPQSPNGVSAPATAHGSPQYPNGTGSPQYPGGTGNGAHNNNGIGNNSAGGPNGVGGLNNRQNGQLNVQRTQQNQYAQRVLTNNNVQHQSLQRQGAQPRQLGNAQPQPMRGNAGFNGSIQRSAPQRQFAAPSHSFSGGGFANNGGSHSLGGGGSRGRR